MGFNRWLQYQPVTYYVFSMRCPTTKTWWIIRKRYSEFDAMRKSLLRRYKITHGDHTLRKITAMLQSVVNFHFPRKYLRDDDDLIKNERVKGLRCFASLLMKMRLACMALAVSRSTPTGFELYNLNLIYQDVTEFLQVPEPQVHQELHHVVAKISPQVSRDSKVRDSLDDDNLCSICLDGLDSKHQVLELQCGHSFHKHCVGNWLKDHCTCPLCRTVSFDEEFMVEYVTQVVLAKSTNDLLYKLNQARKVFELFRGGSNSTAPTCLPQEHHADAHQLSRNLACTVCMEVLDCTHPETLELECGHAFHRRCIYHWLGDHSTCPLCRRLSHYGHLPTPAIVA